MWADSFTHFLLFTFNWFSLILSTCTLSMIVKYHFSVCLFVCLLVCLLGCLFVCLFVCLFFFFTGAPVASYGLRRH